LRRYILDDHTCLCDSPGLVFPRVDIGLAEQIIGGLVPLPIVREPFSAVRWLAEQRVEACTRWSAIAADQNVSHPDRVLAAALAMELHTALKVPAMTEYLSEVLQLAGSEDLFNDKMPWSPASLCHMYGKMRG
jgi:hypothetical protein